LLRSLGSVPSDDKRKAISNLDEALQLYTELGRDSEAARVEIALAIARSTEESFMDIPLALEHYSRAEAVLAREPPGVDLAALYMGMAAAAMQSHKTNRSMDAARQAST